MASNVSTAVRRLRCKRRRPQSLVGVVELRSVRGSGAIYLPYHRRGRIFWDGLNSGC